MTCKDMLMGRIVFCGAEILHACVHKPGAITGKREQSPLGAGVGAGGG